MGEETQAERAAEAVTVIVPEEVVCPGCGREFTAFVLRSQSSFGDEEPTFIVRGYARCRWCGHHIEKEGAIEFLSADPDERSLQLDPRFEPGPERDQLPEGETEVILGKRIPGARRSKKPKE